MITKRSWCSVAKPALNHMCKDKLKPPGAAAMDNEVLACLAALREELSTSGMHGSSMKKRILEKLPSALRGPPGPMQSRSVDAA